MINMLIIIVGIILSWIVLIHLFALIINKTVLKKYNTITVRLMNYTQKSNVTGIIRCAKCSTTETDVAVFEQVMEIVDHRLRYKNQITNSIGKNAYLTFKLQLSGIILLRMGLRLYDIRIIVN